MSTPVLDAALKPEALCQVSLVVRDIERTAQHFSELLGVPRPTFVVTPGHAVAKTTFHGQPTEATAKLAFFTTGQVQLELIEPSAEPSVWRTFLDEHGEGVHHIAFRVRDTEATTAQLAAQGFAVAQQGLYSDGSGVYTYMDTATVLGTTIELLESFRRSD